MHFPCLLNTGCHVCFLSWACNKVVNFMCILWSMWTIFKSLFIHELLCLDCSLIYPFFELASFAVQCTLCNSYFALFSICRIAGPCLCTTKKLHGHFTLLCLIVTLYMPNYDIFELLYACNLTFLFIYLFNSVNCIPDIRILNM